MFERIANLPHGVAGKYKVEFLDVNSNQYVQVPAGMGMHVEVKDPDQKLLMGRTYGAEGKFTFTSHTPGEHTMCLSTNSSKWFGGNSLVGRSQIDMG